MAHLPNTSFILSPTSIAPSIVKNLIYVRPFTRDNSCSVEFDPFDFSGKDLRTKAVTLRCNSSGDLYPFTTPPVTSPIPIAAPALSLSARAPPSRLLWHQRLGHPGDPALSILVSRNLIFHNKTDVPSNLCNACQLGKHTRLPFSKSNTFSTYPFEIIQADIWTSPVLSFTGFKFYLVL